MGPNRGSSILSAGSGLKMRALIWFTRNGLFQPVVTLLLEREDSLCLCNAGYLRENSWNGAGSIRCETKWEAGEYGLN